MNVDGNERGLALILGGARSGKSAFAEDLADRSGLEKLYVATALSFDSEMDQRIDHHRARRGDEWRLIEEPLAIAEVVHREADRNCAILVDCLTLWLTNHLMGESDLEVARNRLVDQLMQSSRSGLTLLVSNEVGQGIVPENKMARLFRDEAGRLHQQIAAIADHVWFVTAGLPQKLK